MNHFELQRRLREGKSGSGIPDRQGHLRTMKISNVKPSIDKDQAQWKALRKLRDCERLSGVRKIQQYTTAEHCYYTGLLFEQVAWIENISISVEEMQWVFRHDVLETVTGDVLYPAKNYNDTTVNLWKRIETELLSGDYSYLSEYSDSYAEMWFGRDAWDLFKACDLLELYLFCMDEIEIGSNEETIIRIIKNCETILHDCKFESVKKWISI